MIPPEEYDFDPDRMDTIVTVAVDKNPPDTEGMLVTYQIDANEGEMEGGISPTELVDIIAALNTAEQQMVYDWFHSFFSQEDGDNDFKVDEELR